MLKIENNFNEFISKLHKLTNGNYKCNNWSNYPNSTFYYNLEDENYNNEIAIYTVHNIENTIGIIYLESKGD